MSKRIVKIEEEHSRLKSELSRLKSELKGLKKQQKFTKKFLPSREKIFALNLQDILNPDALTSHKSIHPISRLPKTQNSVKLKKSRKSSKKSQGKNKENTKFNFIECESCSNKNNPEILLAFDTMNIANDTSRVNIEELQCLERENQLVCELNKLRAENQELRGKLRENTPKNHSRNNSMNYMEKSHKKTKSCLRKISENSSIASDSLEISSSRKEESPVSQCGDCLRKRSCADLVSKGKLKENYPLLVAKKSPYDELQELYAPEGFSSKKSKKTHRKSRSDLAETPYIIRPRSKTNLSRHSPGLVTTSKNYNNLTNFSHGIASRLAIKTYN